MQLQKLKRSGIGTWINSQQHPTLFVVGSTQFMSDGQKERREQHHLGIYHFDWDKQHQNLQQSIRPPTLLAKSITQSSFLSLSWSSFGQDNNKYPAGIIGGGMSDGTIIMWDTQKVLDSQANGIVFSKMIHQKYPVTCLEFNPSKPFLLASAGKSLRINDLRSNLGEQPGDGIYKPGVEKKTDGQNLITSLSWHPSIDGYIASTDNLGQVVVWNLKQNKSIYNFKEQAPAPSPFQQQQSQMPASMASTSNPFRTFITWSPINPTQLVIAGNDSVQRGKLRFWDLRHQNAPTKILDPSLFGIHNLTVDSIQFCKQNSSLLLASCNSGKMSLCWDINTESIVSVVDQSQFTQHHHSQDQNQLIQQYSSMRSVVQWSPQLPYVYLHNQIPSNDITIGAVNPQYQGVKQSLGSHAEFVKRLNNTIPKKMKHDLAFSQSINGALLLCNNQRDKTKIHLTKPNIGGTVNNVLTPNQKLQTQNIVNMFFKAQDFERGAGFMLNLNQRMNKKNEIEEWMIIRALLKRDRDQSKVQLINALGLDNEAIFNDIEKAIGKKAPQRQETHKNMEIARNQPQPHNQTIFRQNTMGIPAQNQIKNAEDFFANLGSQQESTQRNERISHTSSNSGFNMHQSSQQSDPFKPHSRIKDSILQTVSRNNNWDQGYQGLIKRSLLSNCNQSAVEVAFKCGRPAQALMIAKAGGQDLFQKAAEQFFSNNADPFIKYALRAIVHRDIESFVKNTTGMSSSKIKWEEALIMAINSPNNRSAIASQLAHELLNNNRRHQARICFMVAGLFKQVISLWMLDLQENMKQMKLNMGSRRNYYKVSGLMSRDIVMKSWCLIKALKYNEPCPQFDRVTYNFVELCLAHGEDNDNAIELLDVCNSNNPVIAKLYNKILNSNKKRYSARFNIIPSIRIKSNWPFADRVPKYIEGNIIKMKMRGQQQQSFQQGPNNRNQMRNANNLNNQQVMSQNNKGPFGGNQAGQQRRGGGVGAAGPPIPPQSMNRMPPPAQPIPNQVPFGGNTASPAGGQIFQLVEQIMAKYKMLEGNSQRLYDSERKINILKNSISNRALTFNIQSVLKNLFQSMLNGNYTQAQRYLKQLSSDNEWQYSKDWLPGIKSILNVLSMSYSNNDKRNMNPSSPFPNNSGPFGGATQSNINNPLPNSKFQNKMAPPPPPPPSLGQKKTGPPPPPMAAKTVNQPSQMQKYQQQHQSPSQQQTNQQIYNQQYWSDGQNQAGSGGGPYPPPPPPASSITSTTQRHGPPPPVFNSSNPPLPSAQQQQFRPPPPTSLSAHQQSKAPPYNQGMMNNNVMGGNQQPVASYQNNQFPQQIRGAGPGGAPPPPPPPQLKKKGPMPPPPNFR